MKCAAIGVMSQKIWGGNNLCEGAKRPSPRERSDLAGGGCGSFFIFRLENVQSGAYLRRKFRLDDMYYMAKRVTIRPIGKSFFSFMNSET